MFETYEICMLARISAKNNKEQGVEEERLKCGVMLNGILEISSSKAQKATVPYRSGITDSPKRQRAWPA
jgi:hypothetical protein